MSRLPRALEEHASFVRALARSLVHDPQGADDVVQETWIAALESKARVVDARAWLSRVVSRIAARSRRSMARRSVRELAVARPERLSSAADAVANREILQRLTSAVFALEEPYQTTILQRYYEGLSAREIAERVRLPLATVRSRIQRALERLRSRLDRECGGDRETWCRGFLPFLGVGKSAAVGAGGGLATSWGGWIMGTTAKVATGLLAAAAAAFLLWWGVGAIGTDAPVTSGGSVPDADDEPRVSAPSPLTEEIVRTPLAHTAAASNSTTRARPAFPPNLPSEVGTLELSIRWSDGTPAAGVAAHLMPWGADDAFRVARDVRMDGDGCCVVEQLAPGHVGVYLDRAGSGTADIQAGLTTRLELVLDEGFTVRGRVFDDEGKPVAAASVLLSDFGNRRSGRAITCSDGEGRYEIRGLYGGRAVSARARGHTPSGQVDVDAAPGAVLDTDLYLRGPAGALHGIVLDPEGFALEGARVRLASPFLGGLQEVEGRLIDPCSLPVDLCTDEHGEFLLEGIAPGPLEVTARTKGFPTLHKTATVEAGITSEIELLVVPGGSLEGIIRASDGSPARDATVSLGQYGEIDSYRAQVRPDGRYRFDALPSGRQEVHAFSSVDGRAIGKVRIEPGSSARWSATLESGSTAVGRVVDESGAALVGWQVGAEQHPGLWERDATTDEEGHFELVNIPPHARTLTVGPPDLWTTGPVLVLPGRLPTEEELLLTIPRRSMPNASLEARLITRGVELEPDATLILTSTTSWGWREGHPDAEGRVRIERLIPAVYELEARAPGCAPLHSQVTVAPGENVLLGDLVLTVGGRVHVTAKAASQAEAIDIQVHIDSEEGRDWGWVDLAAGEGESQALARGAYVLRSRGRWRSSPDVRFQIEDGKNVAVELLLEPAVGCELQIRVDEGTGIPSAVSWQVWDGAGRLDQAGSMTVSSDSEATPGVWIGGLLPGMWRVELTAEDGRKGSVDVNVMSLEQVFQQLEIELR